MCSSGRPGLWGTAAWPWARAHAVLSLPQVLSKQLWESFCCSSPLWVLALWDQGQGLRACWAERHRRARGTPHPAGPLLPFLRGQEGWGSRERWFVSAASQSQPWNWEASWRPRPPGNTGGKKERLAEAWLTTGQKLASVPLQEVLRRAETRNVPLTLRFPLSDLYL